MQARRMAVMTAVAVLFLIGGEANARDDAPEGCEAMNPAASSCTFTVAETMSGPVTGVAGQGKWLVKVKRGKKTIKLASPPSGQPTAVEFTYLKGDKVTATALSPGASLVAGGD